MDTNGNKDSRNFDRLCRNKLNGSQADNSGKGIFDKDWEVFVARYNKNTGKFESSTYCCEDAISK